MKRQKKNAFIKVSIIDTETLLTPKEHFNGGKYAVKLLISPSDLIRSVTGEVSLESLFSLLSQNKRDYSSFIHSELQYLPTLRAASIS